MVRNALTLYLTLALTCSVSLSSPNTELDARVTAATQAFQTKQFASALQQFRSIRETVKDPAMRLRLQWNMARCLEEMQRHVQALRIFEDYAKTVTDPVRLSRAQAKIDKLVQQTYGKIAVSCVGDANAKVYLEKETTERPCPAIFERQDPGLVVIIGRGDSVVREVVQVEAGQTSQLQLAFLPTATKEIPVREETRNWPWYIAGAAAVLTSGALTVWLLNRDEGQTRHRATFCLEGTCE